MEDEQIIRLFWERNESAIRETETKYGSYCYIVAEHILDNQEDIQECLNDTWLRAWKSIPPKRPVHLSLFLARITRNLAFDRYRAMQTKKRRHNRTSQLLEELDACIPQDAAETVYLRQELSRSVNEFLHLLPRRECDIFLRRYFFAETPAEIADRYGLKKSHVLVILSRTRNQLKRHLEKEEIIDETGRFI